MEIEARVTKLEDGYSTLNHGRLDRIELTINSIDQKLDTLIPLHAKLDADVSNIKAVCGNFRTDIDWLKDKRYQDEGAKGMMKWLIPVSITVSSIIVSIIVFIIDKVVR